MSYNHSNQYRCTIIRGKSQSEIDDILPFYAKIIADVCPCGVKEFRENFNNELVQSYFKGDKKKTVDNHRTENAGKLLGMYYIDEDNIVYPSERTLKFLEDNDQPAFFKDICYKMQFPNGMSKPLSALAQLKLGINIRPYSYLLKVLSLANLENIVLTKEDIAYYVLNALDVLCLKASPKEVISQIKIDKAQGIIRKVRTPGKEYSYDMQHITEQLNYLEFANLIIQDNKDIYLNPNEKEIINIFAEQWNQPLAFDLNNYNLQSVEGRKNFEADWVRFFAQISDKASLFTTSAFALDISINDLKTTSTEKVKRINTVELGDEGEFYVLNKEKERVNAFNPRLTNRVLHLGKTKGLGFDIQSVIAEKGDKAEFSRYIEVKSTKRVTVPNFDEENWLDTVNITRNEWIAAQQHKDLYSIFRVYFVRGHVITCVIENPFEKENGNKINVTPLMYRLDFNKNAIDKTHREERVANV